MTEFLGYHCNYVVEITNISLEDKLFKSPNVKYDVICRFKKCYVLSNLDRSEGKAVWESVSDTWKSGSSDVKNNDAEMHIKSLYTIISGNVNVK